MKNAKTIGISFPRQIIEKIEHDRGDVPRSRFIWKMLEKELKLNSEVNNKK